eukprot:c32662_g1_i1 orf=1-225(-)
MSMSRAAVGSSSLSIRTIKWIPISIDLHIIKQTWNFPAWDDNSVQSMQGIVAYSEVLPKISRSYRKPWSTREIIC